MNKFFFIASTIILVQSYSVSFAAPIDGFNPTFVPAEDVQKMVRFLTADINSGTSGAAYNATAGSLANRLLPLSFWSTPQYFGDYVCVYGPTEDGSKPDCTAVDRFNPNTFEISPDKTVGGNMQLERLNTKFGMNIYDSACWQIALAMLAGKDSANYGQLMELADNVNLMLNVSHTGDDIGKPPSALSWRATTTSDGKFSYNGVSVNSESQLKPQNAFAFRMWPRQWKSLDVFMGTPYEHFIQTADFPQDGSIPAGSITWHDYKPIAGENSWAFFVGPMHYAYFHDIVQQKQTAVDFNSPAIQNAINVLPTVSAMQSSVGAVFYTTAGSLGNTGSNAVNPHTVSTENNASLLAGLVMLRRLLEDVKRLNPPKDAQQLASLDYALFNLQILLEGGKSVVSGSTTAGLFSFFHNQAWNATEGVFGTGGYADDPERAVQYDRFVYDASIPSTAQAVDVNTWTIAALGVPMVDKVIAGRIGAAYDAWQKVKKFGGFLVSDGQLCGVGYSAVDGNDDPNRPTTGGIMSGEWTFGAINLVRVLRQQYFDLQSDSELTAEEKEKIPGYLQQLQTEEQQMLTCVQHLQTDKYATSDVLAGHRPPGDYSALMGMSEDQMAYLYASKRYFIPYGWFANPLPSTTSTSWAIMTQYGFNPFVLGGDYSTALPATRNQ